MHSGQAPFDPCTYLTLTFCFAYLCQEGYWHRWAVNPPVQTAVLPQEDPETPGISCGWPWTSRFALSGFNPCLGNTLLQDLSSGRVLQAVGFMAVWYRHCGIRLMFGDNWSGFIISWANPAPDSLGIWEQTGFSNTYFFTIKSCSRSLKLYSDFCLWQ